MMTLCDELQIKKSFSAVCHPQSNGQTEAINTILKETIKKKLDDAKGNWAEELPLALWAYNTTPKTTTGETPFSVAYGCETMVPVEIGAGSLKRDGFDEQGNEDCLRTNLNLAEKHKEQAQIRVAAYQQRTTRYYNKKAKERPLKQDDLVMKNNTQRQRGIGAEVGRALQDQKSYSIRILSTMPVRCRQNTPKKGMEWRTFEEILSVRSTKT